MSIPRSKPPGEFITVCLTLPPPPTAGTFGPWDQELECKSPLTSPQAGYKLHSRQLTRYFENNRNHCQSFSSSSNIEPMWRYQIKNRLALEDAGKYINYKCNCSPTTTTLLSPFPIYSLECPNVPRVSECLCKLNKTVDVHYDRTVAPGAGHLGAGPLQRSCRLYDKLLSNFLF